MQMQKAEQFLSILILNFRKCCQLGLPAETKVQAGKNYETCTDWCKLCLINQTGQTKTWKETCMKLKCMHCVGFEQIFMKFSEIFLPKE